MWPAACHVVGQRAGSNSVTPFTFLVVEALVQRCPFRKNSTRSPAGGMGRLVRGVFRYKCGDCGLRFGKKYVVPIAIAFIASLFC